MYDCKDIKEVCAKTAYFFKPFPTNHVFRRISTHPINKEEQKIIQFTNRILEANFIAFTATIEVHLIASTCKGDIIFPDYSEVSLGDRVVILKEGSKLFGEVVNGHLKDENPS